MKKILLAVFCMLLMSTLIYAQDSNSGTSAGAKVIAADGGQNGDLDRLRDRDYEDKTPDRDRDQDRLRDRDYEDKAVSQDKDQIRLRTRDRIRECIELNKEIKSMVRTRTRSSEAKMTKTASRKGR